MTSNTVVGQYPSNVSKQATKRALANKFDVVMDGTGDSSLESLRSKVQGWRQAGHRVVANYMTVPTDTAVEWSSQRAAKTGRMVPESVIRSIHRSVSQVVPQAISEGLYDEFNLYDNSSGESVLVASAQGSRLQIHHEQGWQQFLAKGKE